MTANPDSKRYVLGAAVGKNQYEYVSVRAKHRSLSVSDYVRKLIDMGMAVEDAQVKQGPSTAAGIDSVNVKVNRSQLDYISAQSRAKGLSISDYLHDVLERGFAEMQPEPETQREQVEAHAEAAGLMPETTRPEDQAANKPAQETMPTERTFDNVPGWTKGPRIL